MKRTNNFISRGLIGLLTGILFLSVSCDRITYEQEVMAKVAVFKTMAEIRKEFVGTKDGVELQSTGKIYIYKDFLLINEPLKGIHFYNNSNPAKPEKITFLAVEGTSDFAIKDDVLYTDNYADLLLFDLKNIAKPTLMKRVEDVFKTVNTVWGWKPMNGTKVVAGWKDSLVTYKNTREHTPFVKYDTNINYDGNSGGTGQAGSLARFTISKNHLYTVDISDLNWFDISNKNTATYVDKMRLSGLLETIFPYKDNLFIGTTQGMHIISLENPAAPKKISTFAHFRACDPVVVNDKYAFVTLRSGIECGGGSNELQVIDIADLSNPKLKLTQALKSPYGLGLSGNMVYLTEGMNGFRSFAFEEGQQLSLKEVQNLPNMMSYDVIPGPKSMIVIGPKKICQYDYQDKSNIKELGCINITPGS
ncbi:MULTISPECIES: LVIVD repeat-containing protein [unclassified Sphingobacterium]|uniref:LVIVD repeat-containing protein n=1 Tax=unclassified Sphingobacterium TaxID=2609468 RepID=UPI000C0BEB84|nr:MULTISPECIES: hypothetical protein [unclassified Sphingobacterium]QBR10943.1 hypothetical protein E3D81_01705 [Sphingobacterium sp. CZ-2]